MAGRVRQIDGMFGRCLVEIRRGDVAPLGELAFVPAATAYPGAGGQACRALTHPPDYFVHVARIAQVKRVRGLREVDVRVDQPGRCGFAREVHHSRPVTDVLLRLRRAPDKNKPSAADGDRLRNRVLRVNRDDRAVHEDNVRGHGWRGLSPETHGHEQCEGDVTHGGGLYATPGDRFRGNTL